MVASSNTAITKPNVYDSKRIQLTSPILHIGSAVSRLNPFEYVQTDKKVYLPNQEALAKALQQRGRLNDYIRAIEERDEIAPLLEATFGSNWSKEQDPNGESVFPKIAISQKWTDHKITDLRPMIRNGMGQLYIPGSSIKGAIRTAITYHLLKHADCYQVPASQRVSKIEEQLRQKLKSGELKSSWKQKFADDELFMNSLFSNFSLSYQNRTVKARTGPNTDFMRAIQVTDCQPLVKGTVNQKGKAIAFNAPVAAEVIVSSHFEDERGKYRASIYAEMVRNVRTEFTLSLDTQMLSWFRHQEGMQLPFQSLDDVLKICQEFAQEQWDGEHDYWQAVQNHRNQGKDLDFSAIRDFYEKKNCPYSLRLGWASGMNGTTIGWLLDDQLRADIRDTCGIRAPNFEAPKSRRTVLDPKGEIRFVPGWVKFKGL
jgi:CRISPR-associated protein Csm5